MREAGVPVAGVHFETGFVRDAHAEQARRACELERITILDVRQRYLEQVVSAPRFGYGSGMNPCHDCRAFMLARADEFAAQRGVDLLFTGDVIGQRSHDQSHRAFGIVDREAGVQGRVLRPLCAGHLETVEHPAARLGDRAVTRLQGRARRAQLELAERWCIRGFPNPSGRCCRLAEPAFGRRVRDYLEHRRPEDLRAEEIPLLSLGRHFRLSWETKVILSRNEDEARRLDAIGSRLGRCRPLTSTGAEGWIETAALERTDLQAIGSLVARYTPGAAETGADVGIVLGGSESVVHARPVDEDTLSLWRI
jgi:hypothetical protein